MADQSFGGRARVERHLRRAEGALTTVTGGKAVCTIGWTAQARPAVKYREGAVSALAELRRHLRRDGIPDTITDLIQALDRLQARWRTRTADMAAAGAEWEAYFRGGLDALDALACELRSS
jgi:hypothetical protein